MNDLNFIPVRGKELSIRQQAKTPGYIYFATDTGKMFLDTLDEATGDYVRKAIGGSGAAVLYANNPSLTVMPDNVTYILTTNDLENDQASVNVGDLIINIDGKFLRVSKFQPDGSFYCSLIAVSGTGGGGGDTPSDTPQGSALIETVPGETYRRYRYGEKVYLNFNFSSSYADGTPSGSARAEIYVNDSMNPVDDVIYVSQGANTLDVTKYLQAGYTKLLLKVYADIGNANALQLTRTWELIGVILELDWKYSLATINNSKSKFILKWTVKGDDTEKTTHINIDNDDPILVTTTANKKEHELELEGLSHGVHTVSMYMTGRFGSVDIPTDTISHQMIFIDDSETAPLIAYTLSTKQIVQYDTINVEVAAYDPNAQDGIAQITVRENDIDREEFNIKQAEIYSWTYTPTTAGEKKITFVCGSTEVSFLLEVDPVDLGDVEEDTGYAFKIKASDISGNDMLRSWSTTLSSSIYDKWPQNKKTIGLEFSSNFDWINGGLKQETLANGQKRNYICVRAGTTMTINYDLFRMSSNNVQANGKSFKFIFKTANCKDYDAQVLSSFSKDDQIGLLMRAQDVKLQCANLTLSAPYCEDRDIEFEFDIWPQNDTAQLERRYIQMWMDGVPTNMEVYSANSNIATFDQITKITPITIGSEDCDVYVYLIKVYEKHLSDEQHLYNFICDAHGADEIMSRYNRNNILENGRISYRKLVEQNPGCQAHLYNIPRMTKNKDDKVGDGKKIVDNKEVKDETDVADYYLYEGSSNQPVIQAVHDQEGKGGVIFKVQGTSSARYGVAAFNLDSQFKQGFIDANGNRIDGYSLTDDSVTGYKSIPVNYFTTKVNVASCEGANNAINAEWYNKYQPWKNRLRRTNPNARDCMEFKPGIVFIQDNNPNGAKDEYGTTREYTDRNLFADTNDYINNPYYKMYAVGCMGNSKKNVTVLHDTTNPYECCIENADNQELGQWMTALQGTYFTTDANGQAVKVQVLIDPYASIDDKTLCPDGQERSNRELWEASLDNLYEFRYPDGIDTLKETFPKWDAEEQAKWPELEKIKNEPQHILNDEIIAKNPADAFIEGWYRFVSWMVRNDPCEKYSYIYIADAEEFAKKSPLFYYDSETQTYEQVLTFTAPGMYYRLEHPYGITNEKLPEPVEFKSFTFKTVEQDPLKGYNNGCLAGQTISTYAKIYEYDTSDYRIAKMLSECEDYLCMESVVFHYLFIERHTMVDNVAKNTFWSTENGIHWNLTKNYDNDTADGNDNQGRLSLTYGIECLDKSDEEKNLYYFNANASIWFRFINGLYAARQIVYKQCYRAGAWSAAAYTKAFKEWQSTIPEICWIEDYYRKYRRPRELGLDQSKFYMGMLAGGLKTHQRDQYETYQESYINSLYNPDDFSGSSVFTIRGSGELGADPSTGLIDTVTVKLYADGYIRATAGSNLSVPIRGKRGIEYTIPIQASKSGDGYLPINFGNATIYIANPSNITLLKNVAAVNPTQIEFSANGKSRMRYLDLSNCSALENPGLDRTEDDYVLEYVNITNSIKGEGKELDLTKLKHLKQFYSTNAGVTAVSFADGGMLETANLNAITALYASNLNRIISFSLEGYDNLRNITIENCNFNTYEILKKIKQSIDSEVEPAKLRYRIKGVNWEILTNNNDIDLNKGNIVILDFLNDGEKTFPINDAPKAQSLTGSMTFGNSIEPNDGYPAIHYYNKYVNSDTFADFDIKFMATMTPLVSIKDTSGKVFWKRRIALGDTITRDFLTSPSAPSGIFTPPQDYSDASSTYSFQNAWNIYATNGDYLTRVDGEYPIGYLVTQDIVIEPIIEIKPRKFKITFYNADKQMLEGYPKEVEYGSAASKALPEFAPQWPYAESNKFYYVYGFSGWAINNGRNQIIDLNTITITSDREFIAVFKEVHVYSNPLDESYFDLDSFTSSASLLSTKDNIKLAGKITIPRQLKGYDVKNLQTGAFQNGYGKRDTIGVTHIFFEPEEFKSASNFTPNQTFNSIGQLSLDVGGAYIEVPPNITEVTISSLGSHWAGGTADNIFILSDAMTEIPASFMRKATGKIICRDAIGVEGDNIIELLHVTKIGALAFDATTVCKDTELVLGNNIEFGGVLNATTGSNYKCKTLRIKKTGTPNWRLHPDAVVPSGTILWKANEIIIEGEQQESEFSQFVQTYFKADTWTFID